MNLELGERCVDIIVVDGAMKLGIISLLHSDPKAILAELMRHIAKECAFFR